MIEILRRSGCIWKRWTSAPTGERTKTTRTYRKIHLHFDLRGPDLNPQAVEQAIHLAEEKYCSVASTLRGVAQITTGYTIHPAPVMAAD